MNIKELPQDFIIWLSFVWLSIQLHQVLFQRLYQWKVGKCNLFAQQSIKKKKKLPPKQPKHRMSLEFLNNTYEFPYNPDMKSIADTSVTSILPNCLGKYVPCYNENSSPAVYVKIIWRKTSMAIWHSSNTVGAWRINFVDCSG